MKSEMEKIVLSTLGHTWIIDLDGTVVKHNGYKIDGHDTLLPGALEFLNRIPKKDMIIWITARKSCERVHTEKFLLLHGIRYDHIIYDVPSGERILINDDKPSGLPMAMAVRRKRDTRIELYVQEDADL